MKNGSEEWLQAVREGKALHAASSPVELVLLATVPGDARTETQLHRTLRKHRLHGEWFRDTDEARKAMRGALQ